MLFPILGMTRRQLEFDEVEQVYLSKCICCTPALRTKGFQAGGVSGGSGESLWTDLMSMAFSFPRYRGGEANEQQPNELTQDRGNRFLCQNNNSLDEVSRDSRMNVQTVTDSLSYVSFSLNTCCVLPGICGHRLDRGAVHGAPGSAGALCIQFLPHHNREGQ